MCGGRKGARLSVASCRKKKRRCAGCLVPHKHSCSSCSLFVWRNPALLVSLVAFWRHPGHRADSAIVLLQAWSGLEGLDWLQAQQPASGAARCLARARARRVSRRCQKPTRICRGMGDTLWVGLAWRRRGNSQATHAEDPRRRRLVINPDLLWKQGRSARMQHSPTMQSTNDATTDLRCVDRHRPQLGHSRAPQSRRRRAARNRPFAPGLAPLLGTVTIASSATGVTSRVAQTNERGAAAARHRAALSPEATGAY